MSDAIKYISCRDIAKCLPSRRAGRPTWPRTVARWMREGLSGIVLKSVPIAGARFTTQEWLTEFFERVDGAKQEKRGRANPVKPKRLVGVNRKAQERARRMLEAMGAR